MRTYEAMFLLDAGNPDFEGASAPVREVLARAQAEVLALKPWDERRLAYDIQGRKRGLYVLTYFKADPAQIVNLQHEVQLDERILRALVLSADHVSAEKIQAETPATQASARRAASEAQRAARKEAERAAATEKRQAAAAKADEPEKPQPEAKASKPQETGRGSDSEKSPNGGPGAGSPETSSEPPAEAKPDKPQAAGEDERKQDEVQTDQNTPEQPAEESETKT